MTAKKTTTKRSRAGIGNPKPSAPGGKPHRPPKSATGLTYDEALFCRHYLGAARCNGAEAARLCGETGKVSALSMFARRMLDKPHVQAELQRLGEERNQALEYGAADVMRDLIILKSELEVLGVRSAPAQRTRLATITALGELATVAAFKRQIGLSAPNGGPIEVVDPATLAGLSDEELDQLERAVAILDRRAGRGAATSDDGAATGGEGAAPEGE